MGLIERGMGYPCLGFCRLNSIGLGGICEADLKSTMTHLIFLYLTGKPGFVSDPCMDVATGTILHAHCVSATHMDGPQGEASPYVIRSHLEDNRGAVLQVKMRVGQMTSMARLIDDKVMLFSTGPIVDVPDVDRGCRTKIAVKVDHPEKFLENWSSGLHRVIFYGDHTQDLRRFCRFKDIRIVREGVDSLPELPELEFIPRVHA
jgi:L-fucose isomerase-like protein